MTEHEEAAKARAREMARQQGLAALFAEAMEPHFNQLSDAPQPPQADDSDPLGRLLNGDHR